MTINVELRLLLINLFDAENTGSKLLTQEQSFKVVIVKLFHREGSDSLLAFYLQTLLIVFDVISSQAGSAAAGFKLGC